MTDVRDLHKRWMKEPDYRRDHEALEGEFALAAALIQVRANAGLTKEELAVRMGTKQ